MKHGPLKQLCGLLATAAIALVLIGCNGKDGQNGANGTNGTSGTNGTNGTNGAVTLNAAALTPDEWSQLSLAGTVNSVTMGGAPVVNFTVTTPYGLPVTGLAQNVAGAYPNFGFSIAKLVPGSNGSPSRWVNYVVTKTPAAGLSAVPGFAEHENGGTLKDNLDGSYTYTFALDITKVKGYVDAATVYDATHVKADLGDLTYDPTLTHRLIVTVGGKQAGGTVNVLNSGNLWYDFIPATGKAVAATDTERIIADQASCQTCHSKLSMHADFFPPIQDLRLCVVCHTDQHKYGSAESMPATGNVLVPGYFGFATQKFQGRALADFPNMIHKIHQGEGLYYQGYNQFGVLYNEVTYPQDQRNCVKCHAASATAPQGGNWSAVPSRLACGACHDQVDFVAGTNHGTPTNGGAQLDDKSCVSCHTAAGIATYHVPLVAPNPANALAVNSAAAGGAAAGTNGNTNASFVAAYAGSLPAGAHKPTWDLKTFAINATGNPVFTFRFLEDGARKDFQAYTTFAATPTFWPGYVGGPSFYVAMGASQDGIAAPADWNATASIYFPNAWRGDGKAATGANLAATAATTLTGPDATGYYTLTMTGVKVPVDGSATMVTGGIGYTYGIPGTQPLTQTDVAGYPYTPIAWTGVNTWTGPSGQGGVSVPAPNVYKLATGVTGNAGRRAIVSNAKCNDCHAALGIFTDHVYHAGQRNDAPTCTFCHNVDRINSGWAVNIKEAVHSIHAADKRTNKFSWEATAGDKYWTVTYPAILNNCEACHVPGSYDFSASANSAAVPNLLWTGVAAGAMSTAASFSIVTGNETVTAASSVISPWINPTLTTGNAAVLPLGTAYGANYAVAFSAAANPVITQAKATSLVSSPITSACAACHDTPVAIAHFRGNGGSFYAARPADGTLPANVEQCLICHGNGKVADIRAVHMTWK